MITKSITEIIKYVMNNQPININAMSESINKTPQYLRNEILDANIYLNPKYEIFIKNSMITSNISYSDYISIMQHLQMKDYTPNQDERFDVILVKGFFEEYLNLTKLYTQWGLSLTTKKRDLHVFEAKLNAMGLALERKPGSGVRITGDTLKYRVILTRILNFCMDVHDFNITRRPANSPIENLMYDTFIENSSSLISKAEEMVKDFLNEYQHMVSYYSKKFFIVYTIIALYKHPHLRIDMKPLQLQPLNLFMFPDKLENIAFNQVAAMIDFNPIVSMPYNEILYKAVNCFLSSISQTLEITFHTLNDLSFELYTFVYRQYFFNHFGNIYEDKLVKNPEQKYPSMVASIMEHKDILEETLKFKLNSEQVTSITLILAKWLSLNQINGKYAKRIVLVTNVSYERIHYFLENLSRSIDFILVKTLDINEIGSLSMLDFDLIISFSNRITTILKRKGYNATQVKFFMDHHDLEHLYEHGCYPASGRIAINDFIKTLEESQEPISTTLKSKYPNIFI